MAVKKQSESTKVKRSKIRQPIDREQLEKKLSDSSRNRSRWPRKVGQYVFAHTQTQVNLDGGWIIGQVSKLDRNGCKVGREGWTHAHIIKEDQVVRLHRLITEALISSPIKVGVIDRKEHFS